ncbi:MAG TPA: M3 family metallopeptidase [Nocardioides sp.]|uniref:M3 family metallopeptidase n=1 Tax=Nocardioides sp. TaxID=35761 RepID=UPI002F4166EA
MTDLAALTMPAPDAGTEAWSAWLTTRTTDEMQRARDLVAAVKQERPRRAADLLDRWNEIALALGNAFAASGLIQQVHPDQAIRDQAERAQMEASELQTDLSLDRELYDLMVVDDAEARVSGLDDDAERVRNFALRDFRRSGVDREPEVRDRIRAINQRLTELSQAFQRNIRDDETTVKVRPEQLDGLPQDWIEAHPVGDDGLVELTLDYPDVFPMIQFATDRDARVAVHTGFANRAWPANDEVLAELFALRRELSTMLGYDGWPSYDAEVKMIETGDAIGSFVDKISKAAEASALRDRDKLLARIRQDRPEAETLDAGDSNHYLEVLRREEHDVDAQEVRRYFSFDRVRQGLLDVTGRLFGLTYTPVAVPTWHEDVSSYDVVLDDRLLGRIHLDLHPRPNKFNHAAQFTLTDGVTGRQLPEGVLVCNFPRGLMEHHDVVTLFHEFGHLIHHVLGGDQRWARFAGVATEWDFVEAPSQLLEEWAWDAGVLQTFAVDEDGRAIPEDLVARMRDADDFAKGLQARSQMFYAALSYRCHRDAPADGDALSALSRSLQAEYSMITPLDTHFHASFGHLDGYSSAYYTYMWSLVIAKDLFSAFDRDDLFDPEVANRYRERILSQGGRKDAADLVEDFLGRPFGFESFADWLSA